MPRRHPRVTCKLCGRHRDECGQLSARGKCADCGDGRMSENLAQLRQHAGPHYRAWQRGIIEGVTGIRLDAQPGPK